MIINVKLLAFYLLSGKIRGTLKFPCCLLIINYVFIGREDLIYVSCRLSHKPFFLGHPVVNTQIFTPNKLYQNEVLATII